MVEIRILTVPDAPLLATVADNVFDNIVIPELASTFLADPRHHIAAGIDKGTIIGFASGVDYIHPDKPAELWINEVGVAPTHQGRGIGKAILTCLLEHGVSIGCRTAWVLTEAGNTPARALYVAAGGKSDVEEECQEGQPILFTFSKDS
jgi:ribosomal protein S18 acetylase RimI-like enzyme